MTEPLAGRSGALPSRATPQYGQPAYGQGSSANLADILERVLDKGIVIAGDIQINLLDIELLTIKLRLLVASVDKAKEMGIDWWEHDPSLSSRAPRDDHALADENKRLRAELDALRRSAALPPADADVPAAAAAVEADRDEEETAVPRRKSTTAREPASRSPARKTASPRRTTVSGKTASERRTTSTRKTTGRTSSRPRRRTGTDHGDDD
ncbi:gas vesicle protein [Streptomyces sp. SAJ15]|uniref:gas vesicle protein n=1 Tax=Streptomyces sp. SAJ15 TaxID=2011095 RepID=UPI0037D9D229